MQDATDSKAKKPEEEKKDGEATPEKKDGEGEKKDAGSKKEAGSKKDAAPASKKDAAPGSKKDAGSKKEAGSKKDTASKTGAPGADKKEVKMEPKELKFTKEGGTLKVKLTNNTGERVAVKVKCSDNVLYRVNPVFAFIDDGKTSEIEVIRQSGNPKADKIVIVHTPAGKFWMWKGLMY